MRLRWLSALFLCVTTVLPWRGAQAEDDSRLARLEERRETFKTAFVRADVAPVRFHVLTHAVMLDGWPAWALDMTQEEGSRTTAVYTTSALWNGTSGPLGRMIEQRFTLLGSEQITVPAGTFRARHFRSGGALDSGPASHIWVTEEDHILLKYDWPAYGME